MVVLAYLLTIPILPNIDFLADTATICDIIPKPGSINIYTSGCCKPI